MDFMRKYYIGVCHIIILLLLVIVGLLVNNLIGKNEELSKVKYVSQTIFIQEAPRVKNKNEKIMIDYAIAKSAKKYGVDESLIRSLIKHESDFNPHVVSNAGCIGLTQISPDKTKNPFDIFENVDAGTKFLASLLKKNHGNVERSLWMYNCGEGCVNRGMTPSSTKKYANNIMAKRGKV